MTFRGVFIGIDRYKSSDISWLSCAIHDAQALYALFSDNFAGSAKLLTDKSAGLSQIKETIQDLSSANEEDLVVITYSGHGSDSHELLTYDCDLEQLHETGIPLTELNTWIRAIPAKRILVILDCCFSGGMGAKGISSPIKSRNSVTVDNRLEEISGEGRVIITASRTDEYAYEIQRYQHGLLTYLLMEALLGADQIKEQGKINTYDLLGYVTKRVEDESAKLGRVQHPTMRGSIDGSFVWPVFKKGNSYAELFPERQQPPVTSDLSSLQPYGFPAKLLSQWKSHIPTLNDLQLAAINEYNVLKREDLIVSAPTSSGKTMIGEIASIKGVLGRKRALFLLPLKAIVDEKYRYFRAMYGAYGFRIIRATGDSNDDVPDLISGRYDICLLTYEKFTALFLANPFIVDSVGTVVVDEVQMITDESRGANLEFILTLLRIRRQQLTTPQLICLSAVIGDTNGLERWLGGRLLYRTDRPVPLDEGMLTNSGSVRYLESDSRKEKRLNSFVSRVIRNGGSQELIIPLVCKLVSEGKQVIVFREQKGQTRGAAQYLAEFLGLLPADRALESLPDGDPSLLSSGLKKSLQGGVAIHNADLDRDERRIVEEHFREKDSQIRVMVATTTLAMGINTPAEAVIVAGLNHPGLEPTPYSVAEYKNIVGRAGRLGFSARGKSYLLALDPYTEHEYWNKYICGEPEDLQSRFFDRNADFRTLIIRVLAAARSSSGRKLVGFSVQDTINFLSNSFGAYQLKQQSASWRLDEKAISDGLSSLKSARLIDVGDEDKFRLTELGWLAGHAGIEIESIIRIIRIMRSVTPSEISDPCILAAIQCTVELDNVYMLLNSKGIRKEKITWSSELARQGVPTSVINIMQQTADSDYRAASRFKRAAACLLWISDSSMKKIEEILTQHGRRFDGAAGPVRSASSRTNDLLAITFRITELLHSDYNAGECLSRLSIRLESGIHARLLNIATFVGNQLSRADYHEIYKVGVSSLDELDKLGDDELSILLSNDGAKVQLVRQAAVKARKDVELADLRPPLLPDYEM